MKEWLKQEPEEYRAHYPRIGMPAPHDASVRPASIVIDFTLGFPGSRGLSLADTANEFPTACGPAAWCAVPRTLRLLHVFRRPYQSFIPSSIVTSGGLSVETLKSLSEAIGRRHTLTTSRMRSHHKRADGSWESQKLSHFSELLS